MERFGYQWEEIQEITSKKERIKEVIEHDKREPNTKRENR